MQCRSTIQLINHRFAVQYEFVYKTDRIIFDRIEVRIVAVAIFRNHVAVFLIPIIILDAKIFSWYDFGVLILVIYFITDYREVLQKCLEKLTDVNFGVNSSEEV